MKAKYNKVAFIVAIISFMAFIFGALMHYMRATSKMDQLDYDMNTITAGDFSVEMKITSKQYEYFQKNI